MVSGSCLSDSITKMLNLILIAIFIIVVGSVSSSSPFNSTTEPCNGRCGGTILPHPFGFSPACPIQLTCSAAGAQIGGIFSVQNVTERSIFVGVPHDCNRSVEAMGPLFSEHYAPTSENSFLMEECANATDEGCSIKQKFLETQLNLKSCDPLGKDRVSCFSTDANSSSSNGSSSPSEFFRMEDLRRSSCKKLFSSIAFESVGGNAGIALEFERVRLGWWVKGECGTSESTCEVNATCKRVRTPDGSAGHRCSCMKGYHGDGFIKSPCRKG